MAGQMTDVQQVTAAPGEVDSAGFPVPIADASKISWTVGDPTIASVTVDPTTGVATFAALKPGVTPVGVTDSSNGLAKQDTLTVTADVATGMTITFGVPTSQVAPPAVG